LVDAVKVARSGDDLERALSAIDSSARMLSSEVEQMFGERQSVPAGVRNPSSTLRTILNRGSTTSKAY